VAEDRHRSFGHDLVGQTWELALPPAPRAAASAGSARGSTRAGSRRAARAE
jgi:hypothetical protein